jgi:hypothetical protein
MAHERKGVIAIMIVVLEHKYVTEIIQGEFIEAQGELSGYGADEHGHFFFLFYAYVVKFLGALYQECAEQEAMLFCFCEAAEISEVGSDYIAIIIFLFQEGFVTATLHKSSERLL